jgi:TonB family protein
MFGNLIESRSHTGEFARRGYFIVGTTICYGALVIAAAVGSVFAYDANLETQDMVDVTMITPTTPMEIVPEQRIRQQTAQVRENQPSQRTALVDRLADSNKVPDTVSTTPSNILERPVGPVVIGPVNIDRAPSSEGIPGPPTGPSTVPTTENHTVVVPDDTIPPVPHKVFVVSKGPVTGQAIFLPKPVYPRIAIDTHASGPVKVQVLIDETGKVVSAQVLEGHPMLRSAALQVAWQAKFNPTTLGGSPVKVSGYIVYNFIRQ